LEEQERVPREMAKIEYLILKFLEILAKEREATRGAAERKLTLTADELDAQAVS
jgi:hypothetical protein